MEGFHGMHGFHKFLRFNGVLGKCGPHGSIYTMQYTDSMNIQPICFRHPNKHLKLCLVSLEVWKVRGEIIRVEWAESQIIWSRETSGDITNLSDFHDFDWAPTGSLPWDPLGSSSEPKGLSGAQGPWKGASKRIPI